ncbi:hypothetical protein [Paracoccus sp. SCSIO 75233]|uniref:hypothetical protein n=1 Tax=Paracoccus sp. SCSIO 75233 TaxID=3017782 RepID=UPI0022EFF29A|nr:hypothetical protein [Paracoccus sp. SCSIO 75233]WBU53709.1 hypothetical protein PAF12_02385 [Paracoccus sp. SCSIO 75233]
MISASEYFDQDRRAIPPEVEAAFYASLKMNNASFKTTRHNRFEDLDDRIAGILAGAFPGPVQVLDVGVSAAVSTLELLDALKRAGVSPEITGTDLYLHGYLVDLGGGLRVLSDQRGWPLQYEFGSRATRPWIRRLDYLTLMAPIRFMAARVLARRVAARIAQGDARPVTLASRGVTEAPEISLVEDDVLVPRTAFRGRFNFIRAANILNLGYFSEDGLKTAIGNLRDYLAGPGSLLLVVRTQERSDRNDATLFELTDGGRLEPRQQFNRGSEIAGLVAQIGPDAPQQGQG